jgi:predicted nucleotidyltransferase
MLSPDFREFVTLLNGHGVEYLIVGGYAVGIHGHPRYTGDLDVWLNPTVQNAKNVVQCLNAFGFSSFGLTEDDFIKPANVIQLGYPPQRIDLLTDIDGVEFAPCYESHVEIEIDGVPVRFISRNDLITNKAKTARPRDLDDIDHLK